MPLPTPPAAPPAPSSPAASPSPDDGGGAGWRAVTPMLAGLLLGLAALLAGAWWAMDPTPERRLVIATGPEQGAYAEFAKRYLPLLQAHGLAVELRPTPGALQNLALLRDPRSGVDAAFVQGGVPAGDAAGAATGAGPDAGGPVSLGSVAIEPLWLFYREARLTAAPPERLAELAGWRIHTGPAGDVAGPLFAQLARANGLPPETAVAGGSLAVNGVVELVQGRVDALVLVSAAEAPLVQYLLNTPGVRLLDFSRAEAHARRFPALRPLLLPRGVIDLAADQPPQDVRLVGSTASLAVRGDLHPALRQLLLQAARQVHGEPGWFARPGEYPHAGTDLLPLAPEAERFHRDGPPWLQRYLPFWLASFVDRMWIVLLPLLAALLPLSRIVPPLVTLRLRSRVYRWYAHLRRVEHALERHDADLARLRTELERIEVQTERIRVPLAYAHELYDLRAHIHQVRKRLALRSAGAAAEPGAAAADQPAAS